MSSRVIQVTAPSRLHFGILSVNRSGGRQFGGVGAMVELPGLQVSIRPAERLEISGLLVERTRRIAESLSRDGGGAHCRIEVTQAPPEHVGLGTGTQLSMAIAAALNALAGRPPLDAVRFARCAARGERSAIGLYGFLHGGVLFEAGKTETEEISPLVARAELPADWRFVLICPRGEFGLSGDAERRAFAALPPVPEHRSTTLERLAGDILLPAAARADFETFSEALYEFGYLAGLNFAQEQGGPFAGRRLESLVATARTLGVRGVGQSSWGPTLFALCPNSSTAAEFLKRFIEVSAGRDLQTWISRPNNSGAKIEAAE
ncbi:MAG: hypothetical protein HUU20_22700 [Pirellulales bacterium]|nr:hypothetical protein [Pirellulales bacterium]